MENTESTVRPEWWDDTHTSAWDRIKEAMKRDWEQTKADFSSRGKDLDQDVPDTLGQAAGTRPIPPPDVPNQKHEWNRHEPATRFGFGARKVYGKEFTTWDDKVETKLRTEWTGLKSDMEWDKAKDDVRYGWDYKDDKEDSGSTRH